MPEVYFTHNRIKRPAVLSQSGSYAKRTSLEEKQFTFAMWEMSRSAQRLWSFTHLTP